MCLIGFTHAAMNVVLSNQGTGVKHTINGTNLETGNLQVIIYDAASGGNTIYSEVFTGAIVNGSWNVMLGEGSTPLPLNFNQQYWEDYLINGENVNFYNLSGSSTDRLLFYSPLGTINSSNISDLANAVGNWSADKPFYSTTAQDAIQDAIIQSDAGGWKNTSTTSYTNNTVSIGNLTIRENATDIVYVYGGNKNATFTDTSDAVLVLTQTDTIYLPKTKCPIGYVLSTNETTGLVYCVDGVGYYGGMYNSSTGTMTLITRNIWQNVSDFGAGELYGWYFNQSSQSLVCNNSGVYHISYQLSASDGAFEYWFQLATNNIGDNKSLSKKAMVLGSYDVVSFSYLKRYVIGDKVQLQVVIQGADNKVLTLANRNVNVFKVGS